MLRLPTLLLAFCLAFASRAQQLACTATVETVAQHQGDTVVFCGTPTDVHASKKADGPVFMDFGGAYPDNTFVVVIFNDVFGPDRAALMKRFTGKALRIRGVVKDYKGKPEIVLKRLADIEVEEAKH